MAPASRAVCSARARRRGIRTFVNDQIPKVEREEFIHLGYTIGGMMVFPAQRVGGKMAINSARGFHPRIKDRFDLTVECIRRHYLEEPSPLGDALARYADFFAMFGDFAGYVDFFHLQDLVDDGTGTVTFFAPFEDFIGSPVPATLDAYVDYRQRAIDFIESCDRRIAAYIADHPPEARPVWASPQFEAVLTHAEAVGQRAVLEELLAAGDRLGLYARPYI
jgi:hypothetical protein